MSRIISGFFFLNLLSCTAPRPINDPNMRQPGYEHRASVELPYMNLPSDYNAYDIILTVNKAYGNELIEGDIKSLPKRYRNAVSDKSKLWPNTSIPYSMDPQYDADEVRYIKEALGEFHRFTCIRFTPRIQEEDYISFVQHKGCYSPVGRTGGEQEVTLGKPCLTRGTAIHEIMHSLGFWHEQSRSDRDNYIHVLWENIEEGREFNFEKFSISEVDVLGSPYDYGSVMHYSRTAFSKNGNSTIRPTGPTNKTLGQRDHLSEIDAWKVNILYKCSNTKPLLFGPQVPPTVGTYIPSHHLPPHVPPKLPIPTPKFHPTHTLHHIRTPPPLHSHSQFVLGPFSDWSPCDIDCIGKRTRICLDFIHHDCGPGSSVETRVCPPPCHRAEYIGCWKNKVSDPAIPMIENQRSASLEFHTLEAYRECADAALELGYPVFALFRDGDCLTGPDALFTFAKYGESTMCGRGGQGSNEAMDVYTYISDIDGDWSGWQSWESCSQNCGNGTSIRRRFCNSPPFTGQGIPCQGNHEERRSCNQQPCKDIDGGWSEWSHWTACSRLCGFGIQYRNRKCDNPAPSGGGLQCPGADKDSTHCYLKDCEQSKGCGNEAHYGTHGVINQGQYGKSMSCEYHVITYTGTSVLLNVDRMDIEDSPGCTDDVVVIFDGNSTQAPVLATLCGNRKHAPIRSSRNELLVLFESDSTLEGSGFTLTWSITHSTYHMCPQPIEPFHGVMNGTSTYVGDSFRFRCNQGYHLIGPQLITCVTFDEHHAVWDDGYPRCDKSNKQLPVIEIG